MNVSTLSQVSNTINSTLHSFNDNIYSLSFHTMSLKLSFSGIWCLSYFFVLFYIILVFSVGVYLLPNSPMFSTIFKLKNNNNYLHISSVSLFKFLITPLIVAFILNSSWTGPSISAWFGHISFSSLQCNITYFIILSFFIILYTYSLNLIFNSKEVFDFIIVIYSSCLWTILLFYANNIFTVIFFIETLSVLTTLVLITSSFSSAYFYNTNSFTNTTYFSSQTPNTFLMTLTFFFWTSLVSSLLLFVFLIFFYTKFLTFEFVLIESLFNYIISISTFKQVLTTLFITFIIILVTFFKCGVVPLYIWKPVFFKGMSLQVIFFYICFFYYFLLLFFIHFLTVYLNDLTYYNSLLFVLMSVIGMLTLFTILIESFYIKAFLAMSSILNTLIVFLAISSFSNSTLFLIL